VCAGVFLCTELQKYEYVVAFLDFVNGLHCGPSEVVSRLHVVMLVIFAVTVAGCVETASVTHRDKAWRISLLQLGLM
jgi:hypothetical protein